MASCNPLFPLPTDRSDLIETLLVKGVKALDRGCDSFEQNGIIWKVKEEDSTGLQLFCDRCKEEFSGPEILVSSGRIDYDFCPICRQWVLDSQ